MESMEWLSHQSHAVTMHPTVNPCFMVRACHLYYLGPRHVSCSLSEGRAVLVVKWHGQNTYKPAHAAQGNSQAPVPQPDAQCRRGV